MENFALTLVALFKRYTCISFCVCQSTMSREGAPESLVLLLIRRFIFSGPTSFQFVAPVLRITQKS